MPVTVNIKNFPSKFPNTPPSWNITVSGASEIFPAKMQKLIFLHGVKPFANTDGFQVWSTTPSVSPPPIYMGPLLEYRYQARMKPLMKEMVDAATAERIDKNSLEGFLTGTKAVSPGDRALSVAMGPADFIVNCDESNAARRLLLDGAGWLPITRPSPKLVERVGTMPYRTRDPILAGNLEPFMTEIARKRLGEMLAVTQANILKSKSQAVPEKFDIAAPEGLDYLDFQKGGIAQILRTGKSAIIADDMGLGKTIQAIGVINGTPDAKNILVFCQANMKLKWCREIEKWALNKDLTIGYAEGSKFPETDIVVINYDIAERHLESLSARLWDIEIADEAHSLKNEAAKRTVAILGDLLVDLDPAALAGLTGPERIKAGRGAIPLAKNGVLLMLTGTPKPNRTGELWPLLTSTRPDIWGRGPVARQAFLDRYEPPILIRKKFNKGGREFTRLIPLPGKPLRELELQMRLRGSGSFTRRLKRDTDLPPKFRTPIEMPFKLSKADQEALKQAELDMQVLHGQIALRDGARPQTGRSLQATEIIDVVRGAPTDSPMFMEIARVRRNLGVLKAPYAARFIVDELGEDDDIDVGFRRKTVVFAHHKDVIDIIAREAELKYPGQVLIYNGGLSPKKKQIAVDLFQENPEARIFIMSLAGATGITLTAASRLRVVEMDWSPSNMTQIEDRIWRIGQEMPCDIGYLFVPDSLDVKIGLGLISKMEIDERVINTMSWNEMRNLQVKAADRGAKNADRNADNKVDADNSIPKAVDTAQEELRF